MYTILLIYVVAHGSAWALAKANFREGLSVLEYFISTHGARKGLADTALRTADSGYLTRRLVDVAQDVIIREIDCGTVEGVPYSLYTEKGDLDENLIGRCLLEPAVASDGTVLLDAGEYVSSMKQIAEFEAAGLTEVIIRTVMTCHAHDGVCQKCYGWDLLRTLRREHSETKVLILSARSSVADRIVGLDAGADDYLVKPFAFGELEARIRNLLRREYTHGETSLVSGELRLDTASRQVFAKDSEVNLTKKETAILEYLMRRAGTVVSSEELLSHAWDSNVDPFSNSVRVHIFSVRKKLREVLGYDPISNKVGKGYYLKEDSDDKDE